MKIDAQSYFENERDSRLGGTKETKEMNVQLANRVQEQRTQPVQDPDSFSSWPRYVFWRK